MYGRRSTTNCFAITRNRICIKLYKDYTIIYVQANRLQQETKQRNLTQDTLH